ncbi:MAG TPA: DNA cytosine methyltransferase [Rubricoccaceae bacterium]|jgi:DNA (cytosine-5)-methyltransferase 1
MEAFPNLPVTPRVLDLFCGIGGLSLGLHRAGLDSIGGVDNWEEAAATFAHNLAPNRCLVSDLTRTTVGEVERFFDVRAADIDVIAGGPPCQGFSTIGKRDLKDPRNVLWEHYRDFVAEVRPSYVVIENVEGMAVAGVVDGVIEAFDLIGYKMKARVLVAADYGVPQLRKRLIFLGWLKGLQEPDFPEPSGSALVSVGEAIFDLPALKSGERKTEYAQPPTNPYQEARRKDCTVLHNHEAANHPPALVEVISHVPDGGNRKSIPDHLQPKSGFHNSYARLASWKPAVAVTSNMRKPSSARATHPTQHRGLTVREGLRLQTFDDDFVVLGSRTSQYLQVGNAVPPLLGEVVGREVLKAFRASKTLQLAAAQANEPLSFTDGVVREKVPVAHPRQSELAFPA